MISMRTIREMGQRLGREFHPERVVLFGSHAWGEPGPDSDIDLLVMMEIEGPRVPQAAKMRLALDHSLPIDLLLQTPREVAERIEGGICSWTRLCATGCCFMKPAALDWVRKARPVGFTR
jgi:predicted nucleotidyltransferase